MEYLNGKRPCEMLRKNVLTRKGIDNVEFWLCAHFVPRMSLDLWELEFCIIRIHAFDLLASWGAKYLNQGDRKTLN